MLGSADPEGGAEIARVDIAGVDIAGVIGSRKLSCSL